MGLLATRARSRTDMSEAPEDPVQVSDCILVSGIWFGRNCAFVRKPWVIWRSFGGGRHPASSSTCVSGRDAGDEVSAPMVEIAESV